MVLFGDGARGARSDSDTLFYFSCDIHGVVLRVCRSDVTVVLIDHAQWLDAECWNLVRHLLKHSKHPQQPTVHRSRKMFVVAAGNATMLSRRPRRI